MEPSYIIEQPSNWGGIRPNAGRKEVPDKKKQVYTMVRKSKLDKLGKERVKEIMEQAIDAEYERVIKEEEEAAKLLE